MPVRRSQTGARLLRVLEAMAEHQPIGTRALARLTGDDKSAIHRAIMTLVDEGWVRPTASVPVQWEVSPRILTVAERAHGAFALKRRARATLERLRDECDETVVLIVVDAQTFVVADVVESHKMLRVVPPIGSVVTAEVTAAGRAVLPFLPPERVVDLLGKAPDRKLQQIHSLTRKRGYAVSERETNPGATSIAAPIIEWDGQPCAAIAVIGPSERLTREVQESIARMLLQATLTLSRSTAGTISTKSTSKERGRK
jgi:DNA-binding IclR family transcriptional regulator